MPIARIVLDALLHGVCATALLMSRFLVVMYVESFVISRSIQFAC